MIEEQKEFLAGIISTKRRGDEGLQSNNCEERNSRMSHICGFDSFDLGRATFLCGLEVPGRKRTGPGGFMYSPRYLPSYLTRLEVDGEKS